MASQPVISDDLTNQIYSGWVVTNDPITGFDGKLYGGEQWGYTYTNTDTPEPNVGALGFLLMAGIVTAARLRSKKAFETLN